MNKQRPQRFQPRQNNTPRQEIWTSPNLPTSETVAVYARRSDPLAAKKSNTSNEMQTDDLVAFARRLGWSEDKIIVFAQDMGKSGRLRIDEREGLLAIVSDIEAGIIKAVIVFLEDRLFRDETQIQVNVFIDTCRNHNVLVITPHMTYDFTNRFHVKQFRWRMEEAADYLRDYIQARLVEGRHRVARRGEYTGGALPPGYIIDRQEKIVLDGVEVKNPSFMKYMVYEPHATVVIWLFETFLMLGGNLTQLCNELRTMAFLFPDFSPDIDPRNVSKLELRRVPGGYHITKRGLISILTNVAYIGWWVYKGEIISKQNHPAIMAGKEDVFWYAFNKLAPFTPDGQPNTAKKQPPRYQQNGATDAQALLKGVITTELLGPVYVVPARSRSVWFYALHEKELSLIVSYRAAIKVTDLDTLFVERLLSHLRVTTDFTHYREYAVSVNKALEREQANIAQQIEKIDEQSEGILTSLQLPSTKLKPKARVKLAQKYDELQEQREQLERKFTAPERTKKAKTLLAYYDLIEIVAQHWEKYPFEDRKTLVEALTEQVFVDTMAPHWMRFVIQWRIPHWGVDGGFVWRTYGSGPGWTEEENAALWEHYPSADRTRLLTLLPQRSWAAITFQANQLGILRGAQIPVTTPIPKNLSYADWQFMQERGIAYSKHWKQVDVLWLEADKVGGITSF